jgi:hypothetical protein
LNSIFQLNRRKGSETDLFSPFFALKRNKI